MANLKMRISSKRHKAWEFNHRHQRRFIKSVCHCRRSKTHLTFNSNLWRTITRLADLRNLSQTLTSSILVSEERTSYSLRGLSLTRMLIARVSYLIENFRQQREHLNPFNQKTISLLGTRLEQVWIKTISLAALLHLPTMLTKECIIKVSL